MIDCVADSKLINKRNDLKKHYLIIAALILLLNGCSKITKENYDKIENGMPYEEVVKLLGEPEGCAETLGISNCEWKNKDARIMITFIGNKATIKIAEGFK
jgi:PBP1b-binding outer membrane lipoprotein LpoB